MVDAVYDGHFYDEQSGPSGAGADVVVPMVMELVAPKSVVDFGCGIGTWLERFHAAGVEDFLGIDGDHVDRSRLRIAEDHFVPADLTTPPHLGRKFDLAVSLEVAEHLEEHVADSFVEALVRTADVVLFSAAIPGQTGVGHVNEQWPDYWARFFAARGYQPVDVLRLRIWNDRRVPYWYRQNVMFFATPDAAARLRTRGGGVDIAADGDVRGLVHPEAFSPNTRASAAGRILQLAASAKNWGAARGTKHRARDAARVEADR